MRIYGCPLHGRHAPGIWNPYESFLFVIMPHQFGGGTAESSVCAEQKHNYRSWIYGDMIVRFARGKSCAGEP